MDNLAEKEAITIGPPARCAMHDITLPGHIKTNVITLGNMFKPSYLTRDLDIIGVRIPQTQDA